MKNRIASGSLGIIFGGLAALGPQFFFRICEQSAHQGETTRCYYSGQAEIGVGAVLAALGIGLLFFKNTAVRAGLSLAAALIGILVFLLPNALTGVCAMELMRCRLQALPGLTVTGSLILILGTINTVYLLKITGKGIANGRS